jgi:hypothetical protein
MRRSGTTGTATGVLAWTVVKRRACGAAAQPATSAPVNASAVTRIVIRTP